MHGVALPPTEDVNNGTSLMLQQMDLLWNAGQVVRYHTLPVLRRQTVGEHTYGVLVFLNLLTDFGPSPELVRAALLHDAPEAVVGDLPAPAKRFLGANGGLSKLRSAEDEVMSSVGLEPRTPLLRSELRLLKLADCLEGMRFCAQEVASGNSAIRVIMERFAEYIEELGPLSDKERALFDGVLGKARWL